MPLQITVVYAPAPRVVREWCIDMNDGSTVAQALRQCGVLEEFPDLAHAPQLLGIWGRRCGADQLLRDQDRVEICRPLQVDPKVARRTRFVQQGARSAGLFASRRPGAKAGY